VSRVLPECWGISKRRETFLGKRREEVEERDQLRFGPRRRNEGGAVLAGDTSERQGSVLPERESKASWRLYGTKRSPRENEGGGRFRASPPEKGRAGEGDGVGKGGKVKEKGGDKGIQTFAHAINVKHAQRGVSSGAFHSL